MPYVREGFDEAEPAPFEWNWYPPTEFRLRRSRRGHSPSPAARANRVRWLTSMRRHFGGTVGERRKPFMGGLSCRFCGAVALCYYFRSSEGRCRTHRQIAPAGLEVRAAQWFARVSSFVDTRMSTFEYTPEDTRKSCQTVHQAKEARRGAQGE
jgi:hypothetical protein